MKPPADHELARTGLLQQFVIAARTQTREAACDLLFINGNDLAWDHPPLGLVLANVHADAETFNDSLEVLKNRTALEWQQVAAKLQSVISGAAAEAMAAIDAEERQQGEPSLESILRVLVSLMGGGGKRLSETQWVLPAVIRSIPLVTDSVAAHLCTVGLKIKNRALAATGSSPERYASMIDALGRMNVFDPIRIAVPRDGRRTELAITNGGPFVATVPKEDAHVVEILRLRPDLASLKIGQDKALALFAAQYINQVVGGTHAFPCARYGKRDEAELDLVIPALDLGMEIKLYQAPFVQPDNRPETWAQQLGRQLPGYSSAGCAEIVFVSNLDEERARAVVNKLREVRPELASSLVPKVIGPGLHPLKTFLDETCAKLEALRSANLKKLIGARVVGSVPEEVALTAAASADEELTAATAPREP